jgi:3-hydroxyisobutyrate dehydrogenase-like beta-hydroxyacid dehydrogenase
MEVGFIGLGAMGSAMARNLAKAGHFVRAWSRSGGVQLDGVERVEKPAELFQAEVVFTMLADDAALRAVLLDANLLAAAREGLVHVGMSTISVAFARELIAAHAKANVGYVSAPVLGRPDVAAKGELNILAAGRPDLIEKARPLLDALGRAVWPMGDDPAQANAAKIAVNMMIAMSIEAMGEAVALTESHGVNRDAFFELILGTLFGGRAYQTYSANISKNNYEPGFKARLGLKDLRLATEAANSAGKRLPMLDAVRGQMSALVDSGLGERDWSAVADYTIKQSK